MGVHCYNSYCHSYLSRDLRKPDFCICENKDADQLRGNREADQRLCFRNTDRTIPLLPKIRNFKSLAFFNDCPPRFVSDLVGNPEDRFSDVAAHFYLSRDVRKPDFCICENKDADQLRGNREADQRLCFRYTDSTIPLFPKYKISSL